MTDATRPAVAIGHVFMHVADVARAEEFYRTLGLRLVEKDEGMAILELRGGTHLLLFKNSGEAADIPASHIDFMVDDVAAFHAHARAHAIPITEPAHEEKSGHTWCAITDPDGHAIRVYSSHTEGRDV